MPRSRKRNVTSRLVETKLPNMFPFSKDGTSKKKTVWLYAFGLYCGDNRRKSTPNFKPCEPFCRDRLSTILICRCKFRSDSPTCNIPPGNMEKIARKSWPFWELNWLGNGRDDKGTAPPKLSREPLVSAF